MTLSQQILRRRIKRSASWATMVGLLTGCCVTLIGTFLYLEPDVILFRAAVSGCLLAALVWLGFNVIYLANTGQQSRL